MSSKDVSAKKGTKRKSMASGPEGERLNVVVEQPSTSSVGPVLREFSSRTAPHQVAARMQVA